MLSKRGEDGEDGMGEDVATSEQLRRGALCKPQFSIQLFLAAVGRSLQERARLIKLQDDLRSTGQNDLLGARSGLRPFGLKPYFLP